MTFSIHDVCVLTSIRTRTDGTLTLFISYLVQNKPSRTRINDQNLVLLTPDDTKRPDRHQNKELLISV